MGNGVPGPGPPAGSLFLPPKQRRATLFAQVLFLSIRALVFMFPYNLLSLVGECLLSAALSILVGLVFFQLVGQARLRPDGLAESAQLEVLRPTDAEDRFGLLQAMLSVGIWPLIFYVLRNGT